MIEVNNKFPKVNDIKMNPNEIQVCDIEIIGGKK